MGFEIQGGVLIRIQDTGKVGRVGRADVCPIEAQVARMYQAD